MSPDPILEALARHVLVPVVVIDDAADAEALGAALVGGGLPVAEVTFRTPAAADAIRILRDRGDLLVGAGTVLTPAQVDEAVAAGASYVVSPGTSRAVVERCLEHGVLPLPGAVTATEVQAALELGLDTVKFFPAATAAAPPRSLPSPLRSVACGSSRPGGSDPPTCTTTWPCHAWPRSADHGWSRGTPSARGSATRCGPWSPTPSPSPPACAPTDRTKDDVMTDLLIRPAADCRYDAVSLGEVMLRLDPGEGRIRTARQFRAWEGGGEYNVARGLRRAFGLRAAVVTALADNEVGPPGRGLHPHGRRGHLVHRWVPYDGIGRAVRNGLNFTERGFGVRGAVGVSDRGHTAASQLAPGDVDWEHLFGELGVRWFHTGGIFAALSETAARDRPRGGHSRAHARHRRLLRPQLPTEPVEGHRRPGSRPGSEPGDRLARRRHDRQRGGLHRLARVRGRGRRRGPDRPRRGQVRRHDRATSRPPTRTSRSSPPPCARCAARPSTTGAPSPGPAPRASSRRRTAPGLEILDRVGGGGLVRVRAGITGCSTGRTWRPRSSTARHTVHSR